MLTAVIACTSVFALLLLVNFCLGSSEETSGSLECEHALPRLPYTTVARRFRDKCFQFVSVERYWPEARHYCHQFGGELARIGDSRTNEFIVTTLNGLWWQNNGVWIGLNDRNGEQQWHWDSGEPMLFANWAEGHPMSMLHQLRDCVRMVRANGLWLWRETPCESFAWKYHFICQYMTTLQLTTESEAQRETEKPRLAVSSSEEIDDYSPEFASVDVSNEQPLNQASLATIGLFMMILAVAVLSIFASSTVAVVVVVVAWKRCGRRKESFRSTVVHSCSSTTDSQCSADNCEAGMVASSSCETSPAAHCRHVTANYYVNPPWSTPTHRLLPCPPVPAPPGTGPPSPAAYCPMDGTVRRLGRTAPAADAQPSPDDDATAAAYVPMDLYNRLVTGSSSPQTGSDVIDECAAVDENIYEPLSDVALSECDDE